MLKLVRRGLLIIAGMFVLAGCGGGDPAVRDEAEATVDDSLVASTEVALPPLTSVPFSEYGTSHVNPPVSFATSPSTGGDHYGFWQNCGFYTEMVVEGAATHTLEHGAIWITYNADVVSNDDLAALEALSAGNGKLIITPYDQDDTIILSAWGVQQRGVAPPSTAEGSAAITEFINSWVDNPELVEAGVSCNGSAGVPPDQPRLFPDGQEMPDEFS